MHADLYIDHSNASSPCPTSEHQLHHFRRFKDHDKTTHDRIRYAWQCSVEECRASLFISYRKPRIEDEDKDLLTHPDLLKKRYDALVQEDPNREGIRQATQMDSLVRLRKYIKDSLNPQHNKRQLPANNKRFQEAFGLNGQDCSELLTQFGFKYAVSSLQEGQEQNGDLCGTQDVDWHLPNPEQVRDRLQADGNTPRELLEDVEIELLLWQYKLASEQGLVNPSAGEILSSANRDIERTLAAQGCMFYATSLY